MKDDSANPNPGAAETIFKAALAFNAAERPIYLAGACRDNLPLRQQVEALLRAHDAPQAFPPGQPPSPNSTIKLDRADAADEAVGQTIGRYKLLEKVGEGGCGVVYVAEQTQPVRRRVALKVIKLGMDTKAVVVRFEAERQALAMMDHPNIAKVLDAGATDKGRPYFVMELVRGIRITDYCDQANLSTKDRLELVIKVCQAIQHAHQKGIIHRDIKPSNILVTLHDGVPVPKVIDFGIAKATEGRLTDATVYTQLQQFIGTPAYMSPEQAEMSGLDIDTRSDIYSLGVLLYELLAGSTPFDPAELLASGIDAMRNTIRHQEPVRPSTRLATLKGEELTTTARLRASDVPKLINMLKGDLDWIVMKCLEKDRTRRYETAIGLAADLKRHLDNEPVVARPPSSLYRFQKMVRRNKLFFAAGSCVAAAVLAGLAVSTYLFIQERQAHSRALAAENEQSQLRKEAEAESRKARTESKRAEEAATEVKMNMAASDSALAVRLLAENQRNDALAYLARSLSLNPSNEAVWIRLTSLLNSQSWWIPTKILKHTSIVHTAQFSPDGKRIETAFWRHPMFMTSNAASATAETGLRKDFALTTRVWDAQSGKPLTKPLELGFVVWSAQFSPDGKRIVTALSDDIARVWDAKTGQPLTEPMQHSKRVDSAQFSQDGKRIVTASWDDTARVWDAQSGQSLTDPLPHSQRVIWAQFSPDGKQIVTACRDKTVRVWDARSGKPLTQPFVHGELVNAEQFSPDGKRVVTASSDGIARLWDAQSGQLLTACSKHSAAVKSAQFSPDGKWILTASDDHTARVWDAQSGQPLTEPLQHADSVESAQFSPDGKRILAASGDCVWLWDAVGGQPLAQSFKTVGYAQFSPDGKRLVTTSRVNSELAARVWDVASGQPLSEPFQHSGAVKSAQFSPDARQIVIISMGAGPRAWAARVWDAQTGQPLTEPMQHSNVVSSAQFSPDGKRIVTASMDKTARIWDAATGQPLTEPMKHTNMVYSAQFSPDGARIVTGSWNGSARVWDAVSGQPLTGPLRRRGALMNSSGPKASILYSAEFSPDGQRILTASDDDTACVWDARTGKLLTGPLEHTSGAMASVVSARFSPDGTRILTASAEDARVWDAVSGQPLTEPLKHSNSITSAQFSPDGRWIVTASTDHTARVWDAQSGQPLTEPLPHGDIVNSGQFTPDGRQILTISEDGTARVWDFAPPTASHPDWLPQLAEVISGQRLNQQGILEQTKLNRGEILNQLRQRLNQASDDDAWVIWGRWFLADPATRTISPFSKQTVPEYLESRIKEDTAPK
jgi:WD40 repeat protein/tRNA A-37 threonylcarbamoyl transferase component Bud32